MGGPPKLLGNLGQGLGFLADGGRRVIPLSTVMMMTMMMVILAVKKSILLVLGREYGNSIPM